MLVRCLAMMRGGGETRHLAWMKELAALGVEVDVITGAPLVFGDVRHPVVEAPATVLRSPYLRDAVYRWQHTRGFGRLTATALHLDEEWFCRDAWRRIAARPARPDVVHAHALYQTARLRRDDVPVIVNLPGAPHMRYVDDLREADALIADGWAADHLPALLDTPVERVPKGVDAERFTPPASGAATALHEGRPPTVIAVGRLVPIKNMRLLVEAMPHLRRVAPGARAVIVGDGPELAMLQQLASQLGVAEAIRFEGYVANPALPEYYHRADVFALTSTFDNSPNVVLEAMAAGLPVVSTDVGGVREFVEAGVGGTLVPAGDAVALATALAAWLASPERRHAAALHNRRVVLERYSWRASAARLVEIYQRVIAQRAARRQVPA